VWKNIIFRSVACDRVTPRQSTFAQQVGELRHIDRDPSRLALRFAGQVGTPPDRGRNARSDRRSFDLKMPARRFPPPWSIEEQPACFVRATITGRRSLTSTSRMNRGGDLQLSCWAVIRRGGSRPISPEAGKPTLAAFRKALADAGYVEGRNVQIEYRWADGKYDRLPAMAAPPPVTINAAFAAKAATSTIPIVMVVGGDPVKEGLVASLNRPGANATGATVFSYDMESKRLGLLHEAVPAAKTIAVLVNPANPAVELQTRDVQEAAPRLGVKVVIRCAQYGRV
jgi:hypothetical protein